LPTLRAKLGEMQIDTGGLAARIDDLVDHLERPREATMMRVRETKAAAGENAIAVTSSAMRVCGGAAFSKHMNIERLFRDAHTGAVMAPTGAAIEVANAAALRTACRWSAALLTEQRRRQSRSQQYQEEGTAHRRLLKISFTPKPGASAAIRCMHARPKTAVARWAMNAHSSSGR
jgi:hypothetical protein